jgi:hypothetical protein
VPFFAGRAGRAAAVVSITLSGAGLLQLALGPVLRHAWMGIAAAAVALATWSAGRSAGFATEET